MAKDSERSKELIRNALGETGFSRAKYENARNSLKELNGPKQTADKLNEVSHLRIDGISPKPSMKIIDQAAVGIMHGELAQAKLVKTKN